MPFLAPVVGLLGTIGSTVAGAGGIGGLLVKVALTAATTLLSALLAPKPEVPTPDALRNTEKSEEGPGRWAVGRVELEGKISFGDTNGLNIMRVILHAFGEIDEVEETKYDGKKVTIEEDGAVSTDPYVSETGEWSFVNIFTKVGDGTETAWPQLIEYFPGKWSSAHRLRGIAQTLLWIKSPGIDEAKFNGLFGGGIKDVRLVAKMQKPYDPRTDTYHWTLNGVLIAMWVRMQLPDSRTLDHFDLDNVSLMADQADVSVPSLSGTEVRSQLSGGGEGQITVDVVKEMYRCAGIEEYRTEDRKIAFRWLDDYPAPEVRLLATGNARHIQRMQLKRGADSGRKPNVAKVKFLSPERQYKVAEILIQEFDSPGGTYTGPAWARVHDDVDRYGEQERMYEFKFCPQPGQAQRLARREFWLERADVAELLLGFSVIGLWGIRHLDLEIPDVGEDGASIFARCRIADSPRINDAAGTGDVVLRLFPPILQTGWNPEEDEMEPPPVLDGPAGGSHPITRPAVPVSASAVDDAGWEVHVVLPAAPEGTTAAATEFRHYTAGPSTPSAWIPMTMPTITSAESPGDYRGIRCEFRWRVYNEGEGSLYSPILNVPSLA
jgi:hypothetical protein